MVEAKERLYLFQYHLWTLNWRETFSLHYTYFIPIRNTFPSSSFQGSCHFGEASTIAWLKIFTFNFKLNVPSLGPRSKLYSGNFCHLGWTEETTHFFFKNRFNKNRNSVDKTTATPNVHFIPFPLTPTSDEDWISPYHLKTISRRRVMRIKKIIMNREFLVDPIRDPPYKPTK